MDEALTTNEICLHTTFDEEEFFFAKTSEGWDENEKIVNLITHGNGGILLTKRELQKLITALQNMESEM